MRFLLSGGNNKENWDIGDFAGILATPSDYGIRRAIQDGAAWAADNNAFTQGFEPERFFNWLDFMRSHQSQCLFVTVPDMVGNAIATLESFRWWAWRIKALGWPVAFVAQDGQENLPLPPEFDVLFVGGSTEWKESQAAIDCIKRAQAAGRRIHIGRVNWWRRYSLFRQITGSEDFTCDGTRQRFEGMERTRVAWHDYQNRLVLPLW